VLRKKSSKGTNIKTHHNLSTVLFHHHKISKWQQKERERRRGDNRKSSVSTRNGEIKKLWWLIVFHAPLHIACFVLIRALTTSVFSVHHILDTLARFVFLSSFL
jgi:hypothetical protein